MQRVVFLSFQGAQTLDITGPAEVFACANRTTERPLYRVLLASSRDNIVSSAGFAIKTKKLESFAPGRGDTVLVVGGEDEALRRAMSDQRLVSWLQRAGEVSRRVGSVCSGTFLLAQSGLLDGKRAATHWAACDLLARYRPQIEVDREAIFVREGKFWTSAGVTTGIDMALAMVEEDHGRELAAEIAARLVLYVRRPGNQSQFSAPLSAQLHEAHPLGAVLSWARTRLRTLTPEALASQAGLSMRTFHRRCLEHTHTTPAKLVERLRVEGARQLLEASQVDSKQIAARCGFADSTHMGRAFRRVLGMRPQEYRALHGTQRATA
jgi:transcriptional regulator GlxA family with amidase domain